MKHSQNSGFLNKNKIDLLSIKDLLTASKDIDDNLRIDLIENIGQIIGNQENNWIAKNGIEHLVDYIIYRYKFKNYPRWKIIESFPLHLLVEPISICNLRCVMCFQSDPSFRTKDYMGKMDFEFFKDIIDQAVENNCKALTLASRGEPLLHNKFGEMVDYCKNKFFELKINTNATPLTEELSYAILDAGVDIVVFSVDSHYKEQYEKIRIDGNFDKILNNINRFCEIKRLKSQYMKTSTRIAGVYLDENQSKKDFLTFWGNIVDNVSFSDAVPRWNTYNNGFLNYNEPCSLLWERMYVWYDGTCNPCDYDYKSILEVGSAKETLLKEIWLGEHYKRYRNLFLNGKRPSLFPCNRCNLF